jgi:hypothetical protein
MNFCFISCRSPHVVKVCTMCGCQLQILVLLAHQQSKIELTSCVSFKDSNFAPWTQILCVFIMKFSRHLLLFKFIKFATCTCTGWCFGSNKFNTIVHHGIGDVVQTDEAIYMFLFRVHKSIHHQIGDLAQRDGIIYMILYRCSTFAMHVSILHVRICYTQCISPFTY